MTPPLKTATRRAPLLLVLAALACAGSGAPQAASVYYPGPGESWERRDPASLGFDAALLQEAVAWAESHDAQNVAYDFSGHEEMFGELQGPLPESRGGPAGLIVKDGYIVAEWGDTRRPDLMFSATKSFVSTMVGLAYDDGLIADVNDPVGNYIRDGRFDSEHNAAITWQHLLQQTSEWEGELFGMSDTMDLYHRRGRTEPRLPPGTYYEYNDVRVNLAAYCALLLLRQPLGQVLEERIMAPIGGGDNWVWHGYRTSDVEVDGQTMKSVSGGGHWGGGLWMSARDMARFGYLFLRRGNWNGRQLVSERWIDMATTPSELRDVYGYMWWLTPSSVPEGGGPARVYAARGFGGNAIWIDTENALVVVTRWYGGRWEDLETRIRAAMGQPVQAAARAG